MKQALLFLIIMAFNGCTGMKTPQQTESLPEDIIFDKQGHRGCRGLMPENTIPAMKTALDLGVTTLEMDVVITRDKKVVLSHEPFFSHEISIKPGGDYVTEAEERSLNIYSMDYDEVKKFDVGLRPHTRFPQQKKLAIHKPLLSDMLDSVAEHTANSKRALPYFNIETKTSPASDNIFHPEPAEFVDLLISVIKEKKIENRVIIQSFDFRTLKYLHHNYPGIKTAMLIEDFDERGLKDQLKALGFKPTIYSPEFKMVDAELVKRCHEQNIQIIPWTVNDKANMDRLREMGVDGIITDYPNLFNDNVQN